MVIRTKSGRPVHRIAWFDPARHAAGCVVTRPFTDRKETTTFFLADLVGTEDGIVEVVAACQAAPRRADLVVIESGREWDLPEDRERSER